MEIENIIEEMKKFSTKAVESSLGCFPENRAKGQEIDNKREKTRTVKGSFKKIQQMSKMNSRKRELKRKKKKKQKKRNY